jgi:hypothetical protein
LPSWRIADLFVRANLERALLEPSDRPTERERCPQEHHSAADRAFIAEFAPTVSVEIEGLGPVLFCHGSDSLREPNTRPVAGEEVPPLSHNRVERKRCLTRVSHTIALTENRV